MVTGSIGWRKQALAGLAALLIVAGCSHPKPAPDSAALAPKTQAALAGDLLAAGDFAAAASAYEQEAASAETNASTELRLRAALIRADLGEQTQAPNAASGNRAALLFALTAAAPSEVVSALEKQSLHGLSPYESGLFLRTLGLAQAALGQPQPAVTNLMLAERFPMPALKRAQLTPRLWETLQRSDRASLEKDQPSKAPYAKGWLALLDLQPGTTRDKAGLADALTHWRTQFPEHPAQAVLVDDLLKAVEQRAQRPRRIALLLPTGGPLARVAAAIRDGMLAARYADPSEARADVFVFDANEGGLENTLARIRNAQADLIIGPLAKEQVDALVARTDLSLPVLALNTTSKPVPDPERFAQFALSPEDEAVAVANRAWQDGVRRIATLVANSSMGSRQLQAFTARWESLGGNLVSSARFNRSANAYAEATAQLFGLSESKSRAAELRRALRRELAFEPTPRGDIDAVFVAGSTQDAHQLMPQFRYVRAERAVVYGTPAILDGLRDARTDQDLEGLRAGSTAWASAQPVARELQQVFATHWRDAAELGRFYAFGVDAWHLAKQLESLRLPGAAPLDGITGRLSLDSAGVVRRSLYWAEIRGGLAHPLEAAAVVP